MEPTAVLRRLRVLSENSHLWQFDRAVQVRTKSWESPRFGGSEDREEIRKIRQIRSSAAQK